MTTIPLECVCYVKRENSKGIQQGISIIHTTFPTFSSVSFHLRNVFPFPIFPSSMRRCSASSGVSPSRMSSCFRPRKHTHRHTHGQCEANDQNKHVIELHRSCIVILNKSTETEPLLVKLALALLGEPRSYGVPQFHVVEIGRWELA